MPAGIVDLHTHSNASDGEHTPALLMKAAAERGLSAIALTDHDTVGGIEEAQAGAAVLGIRCIPGIEINIAWKFRPAGGTCDEVPGLGPGGEFHLLGLGIHSPSPAFLEAVAGLSRSRELRNREIFSRLRGLDINITWEELLAQSGSRSLGRPHFAALLVQRGIVKTYEQAFACFLRPGRVLYLPKAGLAFEQAAALIRESGGIPVLAHPMSLYVAWGRMPALLRELKDQGLMGIEAWHPAARPRSCCRLEELGKDLGLYITEGSDFHGSIRPERKLGCSGKGREIPAAVLEAIPELGK